MKKINIAEILKDCPSGMELDCTMCDNLYFDRVNNDLIYCYYELDGYRNIIMFYEDGCYTAHKLSKCVIYPKGKTTWEGFQRPFKDGDVITCTNSVCAFVAIYKCMCDKNSFYRYACLILNKGMRFSPDHTCSDFSNPRFATEEEREKLFKAIKENGYKWNAETKTLEKLIEPKFKVGDRIKDKNNRVWFVVQVSDKHFDISSVPNAEGYFVPIEDQDDYELVPNKFDTTTLMPFDKVLVRDSDEDLWSITMYSHYASDKCYPFVTILLSYPQCIPYEGNEHLLGTANDCDEYYKTW